MGILLGLAAALLYGSSDFGGGLLSRRLGPVRVTVIGSAAAWSTDPSRPSEKFGTHSTSLFMGGEEAKRRVTARSRRATACRFHRGPLSL